MVKIGFICEGDIEKLFVESANFQNYLTSINLKKVGEVINAEGNGNLLPQNIKQHNQSFKNVHAEKIIILTDSDGKKREDIEKRIKPNSALHILVLAVQEIEAWFLSDTETLKDVLSDKNFKLKISPEKIVKPSKEFLPKIISEKRNLLLAKKAIADLFLNKDDTIKRTHFFSIQNANCESAKEFVQKLNEIANQTNYSQKKTITKKLTRKVKIK